MFNLNMKLLDIQIERRKTKDFHREENGKYLSMKSWLTSRISRLRGRHWLSEYENFLTSLQRNSKCVSYLRENLAFQLWQISRLTWMGNVERKELLCWWLSWIAYDVTCRKLMLFSRLHMINGRTCAWQRDSLLFSKDLVFSFQWLWKCSIFHSSSSSLVSSYDKFRLFTIHATLPDFVDLIVDVKRFDFSSRIIIFQFRGILF